MLSQFQEVIASPLAIREMSQLITRTELAEKAQSEGLDISERTLRYWAEKGLIPKPRQVCGRGRRAFYPITLLKRLRVIEALRKPKTLKEIQARLEQPVIEILTLGSQEFDIIAYLGQWQRDGVTYVLKLTRGGNHILSIRKTSWEKGGN